MTAQALAQRAELLERIRKQFDSAPYPRVPVEKSPKDNPNFLYIHNLVTAYYVRNQKVVETKGKVILDAGCGSGWKSIVLAEANPEAKIVGIDISEESVKFARHRSEYHGYDNVEFHALLLEDLPKLGIKFDYINCDDVLYLIPDPVAGLQAMQAVLKPDGIIRANLHSSLQRANYFRSQQVFKLMGLMEQNPEEMEISSVREMMRALKDNVFLKAQTWAPIYETDDETILANHLLVGDKGITIPEMFSALEVAGLEFINMLNWRNWKLEELFKDPDNLPAFLGLSLPEASQEEQLQLFELIHPVHRLLDFWCGHPNQGQPFTPIDEWTTSDWEEAQVHLHPQLFTEKFKQDVIGSATEMRLFQISDHIAVKQEVITADTSMALCLLPLFDSPQKVTSLVEYWKKTRPLNPVTLEPTTTENAFNIVQQLLARLESFGCVMLERLS